MEQTEKPGFSFSFHIHGVIIVLGSLSVKNRKFHVRRIFFTVFLPAIYSHFIKGRFYAVLLFL